MNRPGRLPGAGECPHELTSIERNLEVARELEAENCGRVWSLASG